ncbi:unnamed protein product [Acanthoscelides obtectus]|uniref:Uncharacterized protein n=1 Tax=Acanthoscelides obtectus TaxID=200917 RepID=A0A9P0L371_ACAOB|nr:unnamed protein product [Acanthoscelides obtectus]CAK1677889.1 hypothetical protein AOBTE_LOCUS31621 [Acanthoscelides obtectus]
MASSQEEVMKFWNNRKTNRWLCNRSLSPSEDKSGNDTRQEKEMENEPPLICAGEGESAEPSRHAASKKYKRQTDMCYFCETDVQNFTQKKVLGRSVSKKCSI